MMIIEWNEDAVEDFDEIYNNLKKLDIIYAENFSDAILKKIEQIRLFPNSGKLFIQLNNSRIRETYTNNYRIIYFIKTSEIIEILTIIHTKRSIDI